MIKLKSLLLKELFEKVPSLNNGVWFWMDKYGDLYKTDSHFIGGMEYLNKISGIQNLDVEKRRRDYIYDMMFEMGFIIIRRYDSQPVRYYYNPKINTPSSKQLKIMKDFGIENGLDVYDDVTDRIIN